MHYFGRRATQNFPFSTTVKSYPIEKPIACGVFMMARLRSRLAHINDAGPLALHRGRDIVRIKGSRGRTMPKKILCSFGVDVDAVAGWLGSYGGEDSSLDISRGLFAGEVGSP